MNSLDNFFEFYKEKPSDKKLLQIKDYREKVLKEFPDLVKRSPLRLLFLIFPVILIFFGFLSMDIFETYLVTSVFFGFAIAQFAFINHELLHGAIIKSQRLANLISLVIMTPLLLPPSYWRRYHNEHHNHTQNPYLDPDALLLLEMAKKNKALRVLTKFLPGKKNHLRSLIYLFTGYIVGNHVGMVLFFRNIYNWKSLSKIKVSCEYLIQFILFCQLILFLKEGSLFYYLVLPIMIGNFLIMGEFAMNHALCGASKTNDPLDNTISTKRSKFQHFLNFDFGYHIEHHIFPDITHQRAKKIQSFLKKKWPKKYKEFTRAEAYEEIYKRYNLYKDKDTFCDINGENESKALGR